MLNTHCNYHKACSGTLLLIGIIRCKLVGKSEDISHPSSYFLSFIFTYINISVYHLSKCLSPHSPSVYVFPLELHFFTHSGTFCYLSYKKGIGMGPPLGHILT